MKKIIKFTLLILTLVILAVGCGQKNKNEEEQKENQPTEIEEVSSSDGLKIYATIYPLYDFAKKIAEDKADVQLLIPTGQSSHHWEPGQREMKELQEADMLIYNGAGLEGWMDKVLESIDGDIVAVDSSREVNLIASTHAHEHEEHEEEHAYEEEHAQGAHDPHIWLDPKNAVIQIENIANAMIIADPENEDFYRANLDKYREEFMDIDTMYQEQLSSLARDTIVVSHEAYGYICHEYGLNQVGIEGIFAEGEPDAKTMAQIIDFVKNQNITTIFTEELIDTKTADAISAETGAKTVYLNPLEGLSEEEIKAGEDYISVMKSNLEKLVEALS
ncbi:MAG: zinc ABC transporter substrate-binding protein [Peptoniphilus sp.]|nr:zinc ABC transporter substrate-binding protein [Peptoniphilus sp.]